MMRKDVRIWLFSFFFADFNFSQMVHAQSLENGEKFSPITVACVIWGNNIIIPEKNLKKETLEANGMNTISAISYQVINGKRMPAFGGRLTEKKN
jgi:cytochrome c6